MSFRSASRVVAIAFAAATLLLGATGLAQSPAELEEHIRQLELERQRLIVEGDIAAADPYHADDFVLINPFGVPLTKKQLLDLLDMGAVDFLKIDIEDIEVRVYGDGAALRYRAAFQVEADGEVLPEQVLWHLMTYELRDGEWKAVWSVATEVRPMPGSGT